MKILILGIEGMLGHAMFYYFFKKENYVVYGTSRDKGVCIQWYPEPMLDKIYNHVDAANPETVRQIIQTVSPDVVINCIGIIKQKAESSDAVLSISINALFPHLAAGYCEEVGARFIHVSTDCVFSGGKGNYMEDDFPDANDLYGRTKYLGEVRSGNSVTLRTSIIGHELQGKLSLVEWFMAQNGSVNGYVNAIYSGFPTIELARVIDEFVIPNPELKGLYHVSSEPISKYELLTMLAEVYGKNIEIIPYEVLGENKSLDSSRFRQAAGYCPPPWKDLLREMHESYKKMSSLYE